MVAPVSQVMAAANRQLMNAIILGVISILLVSALLGLVFSRKVLKPIGGEPVEGPTLRWRSRTVSLITSSMLNRATAAACSMRCIPCRINCGVLSGKLKTPAIQYASGRARLSAVISTSLHAPSSKAAALEQTAASMEQFSATVKHNAENAHNATALTANATKIASRGEALVGQVVDTMAQIDDSAKKIGDITAIINSIAFQTNIRRLTPPLKRRAPVSRGVGLRWWRPKCVTPAQRSADAVKDIGALIEESSKRVETGVQLVNDAGKTMQEMTQAVNSVQSIISEIVSASDEQAKGIGQVTIAVNEMDGVTQQNASLVQQMTAAATSLEEQAEQLAQSVQQFRLQEK